MSPVVAALMFVVGAVFCFGLVGLAYFINTRWPGDDDHG